LLHSPFAANALLIVSSALIDAMGLFLLGRWIFAGTVRPFLGLLLLLGLRPGDAGRFARSRRHRT